MRPRKRILLVSTSEDRASILKFMLEIKGLQLRLLSPLWKPSTCSPMSNIIYSSANYH